MSKKILIIRFSSIGDIVLTSPVVRALHQQLEGSEIHFLTKKTFAGIVESNPHIHKVYTITKHVSEVLPALKAEHYDYIVDLHNNLRSWQVIAQLHRPYRSFRKLNLRKWLKVRFKLNVMLPIHIVDRYMAAASVLGVSNDGLGLDFFIPPDDEMDVSALPSPYCNGYIGMVIGGKHATKIFPVEKAIGVCKFLKFPVLMLGGPEDATRGDQIACATGVKALNLCGKLSLMQSASLVKQARAIITNDTGLMHVAAAFHKSMVSIWGNTIPAFGMFPYLPENVPQMISEVQNLDCRPCSKIGFEKCPKSHFRCMLDQNTLAIAEFINQVSREQTPI